ncbi:1,4-alpha-glucan branching protein [Streptomyces flavotricini]|uniref:1,4-alpha-glucan branching protein n=1 Tax=Streptomyces flavotricini TaxID=66888 RepID=A0ABS8DYM3_9ACTN|nr:1,4-alpha-glucan branching protein [Streptomyces flavotricini]MCC0093895.1 1,4-alpha-glucan branching protein [Streptomyces flavotricini]
MAVVHRTTMTPGKLELLASWLPTQPWYQDPGAGRAPQPARAGGFRLDDPQGEVGIEFMAVRDGAGDRPVTYHVPLTYRGAALDGAEHALIGTSEHGVLGRRWIYDGAHDPVLVERLYALVRGEAEPQAQSESDTPDPSVTGWYAGAGGPGPVTILGVSAGPEATDVLVRTPSGRPTLSIRRILRPAPAGEDTADRPLGHVTAEWTLPDATSARGRYAVVLA